MLLAAGGLALVASQPKRKRRRGFKFYPSAKDKRIGSAVPARSFKFSSKPQTPEVAAATALFGKATADEYPAPYRYKDVWQMTQEVLAAAKKTSPKKLPLYGTLLMRSAEIDASRAVPNWRRAYALIMTVIIPSFAAGLWWHWFRKGGRSKIKQDRFNAIIAYAGLFLSMPHTATANNSIDINKAKSSLLRGFGFYLNPHQKMRRGDLSPAEIRRLLYDTFSYMNTWTIESKRGCIGLCMDQVVAGQAQMSDVEQYYPIADTNEAHLMEGNLRAVDLIVWLANAEVQGQINVDFDEDAAIAQLVINVIKVVVAVVDIFVGGALGDAIALAASALTQFATLASSGQISTTQVQAMAGAGVVMMLDQAGIRMDLDDEIAAINAAAASL